MVMVIIFIVMRMMKEIKMGMKFQISFSVLPVLESHAAVRRPFLLKNTRVVTFPPQNRQDSGWDAAPQIRQKILRRRILFGKWGNLFCANKPWRQQADTISLGPFLTQSWAIFSQSNHNIADNPCQYFVTSGDSTLFIHMLMIIVVMVMMMMMVMMMKMMMMLWVIMT